MAERFDENLLRATVAQLQLLTTLTAAREMFGKSYFSLGAGERIAADEAAWRMIGNNYQNLTLRRLPASNPRSRWASTCQLSEIRNECISPFLSDRLWPRAARPRCNEIIGGAAG